MPTARGLLKLQEPARHLYAIGGVDQVLAAGRWPGKADDDWEVERDEPRPRIAPDGGAGAHHTEDLVLRARRLR